MSPPDWDSNNTSYGGNGWRDDMPRRYPSPDGRKRDVTIALINYEGFAPGAQHTHVDLTPGHNPVWDGESWATFSDDPEKTPKGMHATFVSRDRALRWIVRMLEKHYPADQWQAAWPCYMEEPPVIADDAAEDAAVQPCECCGAPVGEHDREELASCNDIIAGGAGTVGEAAQPDEVRTLVDCGAVSGFVGDEIAVLYDMHPRNVVLLGGKRAIVVPCGGAANHLAQVAREMGITVMLAANATDRYKDGDWLDIDPAAGTVNGTGTAVKLAPAKATPKKTPRLPVPPRPPRDGG